MMSRMTMTGILSAAVFLTPSLQTDAQDRIPTRNAGENLPTEPVRLIYDFEDGVDPVQFWTSYDRPYTINVKGVAEGDARTGNRAFKLDVTLQDNGRFLWRIPLDPPIPAEGELRLSAFFRLGEETSATATLGASYALPPTGHTGCTYWGTHVETTEGEWQELTVDLVKRGWDRTVLVTRRFNWGLEPTQVGTLVESVIIDIRGKRNQRVVLTVDDITIEGEVPERGRYNQAVRKRHEPAEKLFDRKLAAWRQSLDTVDSALADMDDLSETAADMRRELQSRINDIRDKVEAVEEAGEIRQGNQAEIDAFVQRLPRLPETIEAVSDATRDGRKRALISVVPPISADMILPDTRFILEATFSDLSLTACRGEYEPASFVVSPETDLRDVTAEIGNLTADDGQIAAEYIDIRTVKCWYQAGTAWYGIKQDKSKRILTPELLLHNDALVKVDVENQENYLQLQFPDGPRTVWISDPTDVQGSKSLPVADFPVQDSDTLQPLDIAANSNKQFWVTVQVPEDAASGTYRGEITIKSAGTVIERLPVTLQVLPFDLLPPYYTSSMDYHGRPVQGNGTIGSWLKSWTQFRNELANMVEHGLRNCQHYGIAREILPEVLKVREDVGMDNRTLYLKGTVRIGTAGGGLHGEAHAKPEALEQIRQDVKEVLDIVRPFGTETVYFYGIDEARGERLKAQREAWKAVREAGGKIFVAGYEENIDLMGDIQDMHVRAGRPSREEAERWHALGHKTFCYANPQTGVENPVVYRRNYGVLLWQNDYDGAATNAYQHTFGATWNDFDHTVYRAHTIAYPTVNGVVDTIAWEGYREAVDDVRYITTLEDTVAKAADSDNPDAKKAVAEAKHYLDDLKNRDTTIAVTGGNDLRIMRQTLVEHILALHKAANLQ